MEWWGSDYVQTSLNHFQDYHTKGFSLMTMSMNPGYFRRKQKENGGKRTSFPLSFPPGPSCSKGSACEQALHLGERGKPHENAQQAAGKRELTMTSYKFSFLLCPDKAKPLA